MTTDIFSLLQTQIQPQTPQMITAQSQAVPGLFASLITELTAELPQGLTAEIPQGLTAELPQGLTAEIPQELKLAEQLPIMPQESQPVLTFTGSNSFSQGVIDILAGAKPEGEGEEVLPETFLPDVQEAESEDVIIWEEVSQPETKPETPSTRPETLNTRPETPNTRPETPKPNPEQDTEAVAGDSVPEVQESQCELPPEEANLQDSQILPPRAEIHEDLPESNSDSQEAMTLQAPDTQPEVFTPKPKQDSLHSLPSSPVKPVDDVDDVDDVDEDEDSDSGDAVIPGDADPEIIALSLAAEGAVQITHQELPKVQAKTESRPDVLDSPTPTRQTLTPQVQPRQVRTAKTDSDSPQEPQAPRTEGRTFREALEIRTASQEDTDTDTPEGRNENQSQSQSQGQASTQEHGDAGAESTPSPRSRTTTRKVDSRTLSDRTGSTRTTHRTESRTDFQAFFEGVLSTRRTAARTSPVPLSLRGTENFSQSTALRDGLTNVVRFIRADGVQKANVVVDPPALGRISVELTSSSSGVEASIKVASEQIRQLVQDQLSQLRMNLSQQGVQVAEFTVDVQQDNSGQHNPQGQDQNHGPLNFTGDAEEDETEEFRVDLEEGLLWWVA